MAWPLGLKAMMLHGIIVIDAYLVSSLGEEALAAMGLAGAIAGVVLGFFFAFSSATQIRIAQAFGADDALRLKTGVWCGVVINFCVTCIGLVLVWTLGRQVILSFAHTPWIAEQALSYLAVFSIVLMSEAISGALGSYFNGCSQTRMPFFSYVLTLPMNVGLSIIFIHGLFGMPEMGLVGAAMGSAIAAVIRLLFLATLFLRQYTPVDGYTGGSFSHALKRHLAFSWPIAGTFVSMTLSNQVCMLIYANLSITQFAALTLMMPWVQVIGTIGMSWAQSTGIIVAQLLGKHASGDVLDAFLAKAWRGAFVAALIVASVYTCICFASGWVYSGLQNETRAAVFSFLPVLSLLPFPKISNAICGNTLRAAGDTVYVMKLFVGAQWAFKVPVTALLVLYFDVPVVWVFSVIMIEEFLKLPAFHLRVFAGNWKTRSFDDAEPA
jgi:Na+-driven multidrug efflux pump